MVRSAHPTKDFSEQDRGAISAMKSETPPPSFHQFLKGWTRCDASLLMPIPNCASGHWIAALPYKAGAPSGAPDKKYTPVKPEGGGWVPTGETPVLLASGPLPQVS